MALHGLYKVGAKKAQVKLINNSAAVLTNAGGSMTLPCVLKTLLFSVFLFFYQQGLANDTYGLEEFRHHQKTNWKPSSEKQQNGTGQGPLENIRVGFVRLNLESDDVAGDRRLETCENYEVSEQGFNRLHSLYLNYVNTGDHQYRKVRIQRMLELINRIFAINVNKIHEQCLVGQQLIRRRTRELFEHLFSSVNINGESNPYFNYFNFVEDAPQSDYVGVNNGLVLMLLAFLGSHLFSKDEFHTSFFMLYDIYTGQSFNQAFDSALLSEDINEYHSPQSLANQLNSAELDAETALMIGLSVTATATFQGINSGLEWEETMEALLKMWLPYDLLPIVYSNIASHCHSGYSSPIPVVMFTGEGIQEFTYSILGIAPIPLLPGVSLSESLSSLLDYPEFSDDESSDEESGSDEEVVFDEEVEFVDPSIVIQQQNELIAQLRQELANHTETGEAGAVGGASGGTRKCPICTSSTEDNMLLQNCGHAGFCENCAVRIVDEQRDCPFCRQTPCAYIKIIDKSLLK